LTEKGQKAARQRKSTTNKKKESLTLLYTAGVDAKGSDEVNDGDDE
jgi:hypothetical protein